MKLGLVAALAVAACLSGCDHYYRAKVKMTWECVPALNMPQYPDAQAVRLRFVENPAYFEVVSGRGLCDQLTVSGQKVVTVEYRMWGTHAGLHGFNEESIDGKPIVNAGGAGGSGANDPTGPSPINRLFQEMLRSGSGGK